MKGALDVLNQWLTAHDIYHTARTGCLNEIRYMANEFGFLKTDTNGDEVIAGYRQTQYEFDIANCMLNFNEHPPVPPYVDLTIHIYLLNQGARNQIGIYYCEFGLDGTCSLASIEELTFDLPERVL